MRSTPFRFFGVVLTTLTSLPMLAAGPLTPGKGILDSRLVGAKGEVEVVVQLDDPSLAAAHAANAKNTANWMPAGQQRDYLNRLKAKQDTVTAKARSLGGWELARLSK